MMIREKMKGDYDNNFSKIMTYSAQTYTVYLLESGASLNDNNYKCKHLIISQEKKTWPTHHSNEIYGPYFFLTKITTQEIIIYFKTKKKFFRCEDEKEPQMSVFGANQNGNVQKKKRKNHNYCSINNYNNYECFSFFSFFFALLRSIKPTTMMMMMTTTTENLLPGLRI